MTKYKKKSVTTGSIINMSTENEAEMTYNFQDQRLLNAEINEERLLDIKYHILVSIMGPHRPNNYRIVSKLEPKLQYFFKVPVIKTIMEMKTLKPTAYACLCSHFATVIQKNPQTFYMDDQPDFLLAIQTTNLFRIDYDYFTVQFDYKALRSRALENKRWLIISNIFQVTQEELFHGIREIVLPEAITSVFYHQQHSRSAVTYYVSTKLTIEEEPISIVSSFPVSKSFEGSKVGIKFDFMRSIEVNRNSFSNIFTIRDYMIKNPPVKSININDVAISQTSPGMTSLKHNK